jgi:hypothetical protein
LRISPLHLAPLAGRRAEALDTQLARWIERLLQIDVDNGDLRSAPARSSELSSTSMAGR